MKPAIEIEGHLYRDLVLLLFDITGDGTALLIDPIGSDPLDHGKVRVQAGTDWSLESDLADEIESSDYRAQRTPILNRCSDRLTHPQDIGTDPENPRPRRAPRFRGLGSYRLFQWRYDVKKTFLLGRLRFPAPLQWAGCLSAASGPATSAPNAAGIGDQGRACGRNTDWGVDRFKVSAGKRGDVISSTLTREGRRRRYLRCSPATRDRRFRRNPRAEHGQKGKAAARCPTRAMGWRISNSTPASRGRGPSSA